MQALPSAALSQRLSAESRLLLLRVARRAIEARLQGRERPPFPDLPDELRRESGAFVTLRRRADKELRGCVGYIEPRFPLAETVALAAIGAATTDSRFDPVTLDELASLVLDISVLGPAFPIAAKDVVVGRHGLVVEQAGRRGLLLPQVALEWGWDAGSFLQHTCRKAGLPKDAWKEEDAKLLAFEAEVFGEE